MARIDKPRNAWAIIGMQYGSEGKGALAGYLAVNNFPDTVACNFTPNAGHTFTFAGVKIVTNIMPVGAIAPSVHTVLIGPGAAFRPERLVAEYTEIKRYRQQVFKSDKPLQVIVHPNAVVVTDEHAAEEAKYVVLGSTMKGTAEAYIDRMRRTSGTRNIADRMMIYARVHESWLTVGRISYDLAWKDAKRIQIEGCQGHDLSIYSGFYPKCTSRDTSIYQLIADLAPTVPIFENLHVYGAVRTFPIRVANRYGGDGNKIGDSGGHYGDQDETTFEKIGVEQEITTVTKLPRRVFTFSMEQLKKAVEHNRPAGGTLSLYLSFVDYLDSGKEKDFIDKISHIAPVRYYSVGPDFSNMKRVTWPMKPRDISLPLTDQENANA